ncbi:hypothetical protein Lesp02_03020 [Lentzea sp. NBRC 105346]|uniref:hypothetical protein n=1 Tax=Lentzea sp. NBRC 105346 TaxID=3032205 RepID=UPI0024A21F51|nr:hypothetical protein [Lentzea sp. NBRC 105346]GLZ28112.1 hypothetical protein Lesp02_03020 [Lentzea sp. NBRC 105346]
MSERGVGDCAHKAHIRDKPVATKEFTEAEWEYLRRRARALGVGHGLADGASFNVADDATAQRILAVLDDGQTDDEISAILPTSPLSGEYGADSSPAYLYRVLGIEPGDDTDDGELCHEYEQGHFAAFSDLLRAQLRDESSQ